MFMYEGGEEIRTNNLYFMKHDPQPIKLLFMNVFLNIIKPSLWCNYGPARRWLE
jgi:hypothetical protein